MEYNLPISGMTCASCVARVEKTLKSIDGIDNISVNLASEKAAFTLFENSNSDENSQLESIAEKLEEAGYTLHLPNLAKTNSNEAIIDHRKIEYEKLKSDFYFSLYFSIPIMIISMLIMNEGILKFAENNLNLSLDYISKILLILSTVIIFSPGKRFFKVAWKLAIKAQSDMNTLIAVGSGSAYIYSAVAVLFPSLLSLDFHTSTLAVHANHQTMSILHHLYFDTASTIISLILFGKMLETKAKYAASSAISKLIELAPKEATIDKNGGEILLPIDQIKKKDIVVIKPGDRIPVDGEIISGASSIDESMLTGEAFPVAKSKGAKVSAGTINLDGSFKFRAKGIGKDALLNKIIETVEKAQSSKADIQTLADKVSSIFVPAVIVIALITFIVKYFFLAHTFSDSMINFISVMIIACPCSLGLATPTAIMVASGKAAKLGILIKNANVFEKLAKIDVIVFDKTGTLSQGKAQIQKIYALNSYNELNVLKTVASLEQNSEHNIAKAIVKEANSKLLMLNKVDNFTNFPGKGIKASINSKNVVIGTLDFVSENCEISEIKKFEDLQEEISNQANIAVYLQVYGKACGAISISDNLKANAIEVVNSLISKGKEIVMLSGDNQKSAEKTANMLGITNIIANVLPSGKHLEIQKLKAQSKLVAMVGDGINDAPALAESDVSFAMGNGSDKAIEAADIAIIAGNLDKIPKAIRLSEMTIQTIKLSLFWAFVYNIIGIPLAVSGLLNPMFAAAAMALSSVSVVANSLILASRRVE
jgi:Cu+-exporting ATPase